MEFPPMTSSTPGPTDEARLGACVYILHMLLQRAERQQPGCLDDMIGGVTADRDSVRAQMSHQGGTDVFDEALRMLQLANEQIKLAGRG
jgi:hypothetical protein